MRLLPYQYTRNNKTTSYNRLIVEPIVIPKKVDEETGLVIPSHELPGSACGKVVQAGEGSEFKIGDEVQYLQVDRASFEEMDTVNIEGKVYDVIYEHKIWAQNDKPYNKIFVRPVSESEVTETGLVIPSNIQSVTKKGIIYDAPDYFNLQKGDKVEYQNGLEGRYPQATIDDVLYDVLYASDIFTINGEASPYRIIVKIDLIQQQFKRTTTQSGLKLSPLFIAMLRNLQYGEITAIGDQAQLLYPELKCGDTIIIDHAVESQDYRIISRQLGKENNAIFETRIINCYDFSEREIFAKLHYNKETRKIIDITPLGGSVFMKWEFDLLDGGNDGTSLLLETEDTLSHYHNLDDLKNVVRHKRAEAAEKAKIKVSGIKQVLAYIDKEMEPARYELLQAEAKAIEREEGRIAAHLRKDYLVVCDSVYPTQIPRYIISPYEELYPINILGQNFIIGHADFLILKSHTNMNIQSKDLVALSDNVIVLAMPNEDDESLLKIPDSAKSKPQYGTVVKIGSENELKVKEGDFILYQQHAGLKQNIDGVEHLIMKQNDLLAVLPKKD